MHLRRLEHEEVGTQDYFALGEHMSRRALYLLRLIGAVAVAVSYSVAVVLLCAYCEVIWELVLVMAVAMGASYFMVGSVLQWLILKLRPAPYVLVADGIIVVVAVTMIFGAMDGW